MRNLKKTLCLVLALVFVLGLCTVGAVNGTDFDDKDEILYTTAVKAMSGLGIIIGDDNDADGKMEFRPKDDVTRAEAAKIISYIVVGPEVEKWPARPMFDDVSADHWAAKYITFCQYNKIIAGYGDGKFAPNDPVKQVELAKMLLAACGYGAKGEFEGPEWDQNVAAAAFQTKVLKGIKNTNWFDYANREETALLCYNAMMNTKRVVLSDDTESYEPEFINGVRNVTFAQNPWGLSYETGLVVGNKANTQNAKGTTLVIGSSAYDGDVYYETVTMETEEDENADLLGHEVTVMYRAETFGTKTVNVAYYIDDESEEVSGTAANTAELADLYCTVDNGVVALGEAFPFAKNYRYRDTEGTYVLNAEGKLVAYKTSTYWIFPLVIDAVTKIATVSGQEVIAPEGAETGDMMTVYRCGEIYSVKPCTSVEKFAIFQKQLVANSFYSYNDGDVIPAFPENLGEIDLSSINAYPMNVDTDGDDFMAYEPDLQVGYSYTLYFDAEGGCYAYSDEVLTSEVGIGAYEMFVTGYSLHDAYGDPQIFAQVVKADGTIASFLLDSKKFGVNDANGSIYDIATDATLVKLGDICSEGKKELKVAPTTVATQITYNPADPTFDYSAANFVYYNGVKGTLVTNTKMTPAKDSVISVTYKLLKIGTTYIFKIDTVWFAEAAVAAPVENDSYIYVVDTDIVEIRLINDVPVKFYNGYKDGVPMKDLKLPAGTTIEEKQGFFKYAQNAAGEYVLTEVAEGDGSSIGTRKLTLVDANKETKENWETFIYAGKLWVMDNTGMRQGIDLANVKFVRIAQATDADVVARRPVSLTSVAAIQSLLLSRDAKYTVTIDFVEYVNGITKVHSAGGSVIYITGVSAEPFVK